MAWEERGWRIMRRVRRGMRRPGARHSFDCGDYEEHPRPRCDFDCSLYEKNFYPRYYPKNIEGSRLDRYLASKCDADHYRIESREHLLTILEGLTEFQSLELTYVRRIAPDDSYLREPPSKCGVAPCPPGLYKEIRSALSFVAGREWDTYLKERMCYIREWFQHDAWSDYEHIPTPEQQRQFEKDAWYWDQHHKRVLAARRRVARLIILRVLRTAVAQRAIALYWQEQTQRALCAPGGAGRAADRGTFESEFA